MTLESQETGKVAVEESQKQLKEEMERQEEEFKRAPIEGMIKAMNNEKSLYFGKLSRFIETWINDALS
jgi:hypothetical protein